MKKAKNRFLIMLVILISCIYTVPALAASEERRGTIEINAEKNMKFEYSRIGDIVDGEYRLREEYRKSGVNLNHLKYAEDAERAAKKLNPYMKPEETVITDQNGNAKIENLPRGIYLFRYSKTAVLVTVPTWDETIHNYIYDITIIPKLEETPKTGEDANPGKYFALIMMMGSSVCYGVLYYLRKL